MSQPTSQPRIVIIGAGFGGLGAAAALRRAGFTDLTIVEKAEGVGGVWRENTYPGAACDVPSALYSWSFAPNPRWGRRYSPQPEILGYIERTAAQEGLSDLVRTGVEVRRADWGDGRWEIETSTGSLEADVLIPAVGQLSRPVIPNIAGAADFAGPAFHSAEWRHDVDLQGKRVAVVGTGASAIQFVPAIQPEVAALTVFQRSAPYVVPKPDGNHGPIHRLLSRAGAFVSGERRAVFGLTELVNHILIADSVGTTALKRVWSTFLRTQIKDPGLRRKLTPDFPLGCKRLLFSNNWYRALAQPNVEVCNDAISAIEADGVRTAAGDLHPADVLIWGTGFAATEFLAPIEIAVGEHTLAEQWADGAHAHLGISVPGFPNLFLIYGPNTNLGGSSIIGMMEAQAGYIVEAVREVAATGPQTIRRDVFERWDSEMQERLGDSVWAHCDNWYREPNGRITTNWPGLVTEYQRRTADFRAADFERV